MTPIIAVVEDDVRILDALGLVLEAEGWRVKTYTKGEAFLADLASDTAPQCLILDPYLPGINGIEVAHAVINSDGYSHIPIIVLTAHPSGLVTQQIIDLCARAMLTKPVAAEEIVDQVKAVINTSQKIKL